MREEAGELAQRWMDAVRTDPVRAEIEAVYAAVAEAARSQKPRCDASGRCCHFERWGHRLYVTGLEAAYVWVRRGELPEKSGIAHGPSGRDGRVVALPQIDAARERGDCPFLEGTTCTAHEIKPLGCRVYYCDPTSEVWQQDLTEVMLRRLRALHDAADVPYRYGEWRDMLSMFATRAD